MGIVKKGNINVTDINNRSSRTIRIINTYFEIYKMLSTKIHAQDLTSEFGSSNGKELQRKQFSSSVPIMEQNTFHLI